MNKLIHLLNKLKELNIDKLEDLIEEDAGHIFESLWKLIFLTNNYKNIDNYVMCMGRIESSTMEIIKNKKRFLEETNINNGNQDGILDIKLQLPENKYIFMSSKYFKEDKSISEYDISDIVLELNDKNLDADIWLLVKNKDEIKFTSRKESHTKNVSNILDLNDLKKNLISLKGKIKTKSLEEICDMNNNVKYIPHLHQMYYKNYLLDCVSQFKSLEELRKNKIKHVLGFKCRSGKTYTLPLSFYELLLHFKINFNILIMLLNPTETKDDFLETFDMFPKFNTVYIKNISDFKNINNDKSNVVIISKHLICHKSNINSEYMDQLKKLEFIGICKDEVHNGGVTSKTNYLDKVLNVPIEIMVTYTYDKCKQKDTDIIKFDSTCLTLCKNFKKNKDKLEYNKDILEKSVQQLKIEHGCQTDDEIYEIISDRYRKFPKLHLEIFTLTNENEIIKEIKESGLNIGYSNKSVFEIDENDNWKNPNVLKYFTYNIVGDKLKYKKNSYFGRISRQNNRTLNIEHGPTCILWYLPLRVKNGPIKHLTNKFKKFLEETIKISDNFEIMCVTSSEETIDNKKLKIQIENKLKECEREGKHLIILSGIMLHLAITILQCDIVILSNDTTSPDQWLQMTERSGTPNIYKPDCYALDTNEHRSLTILRDTYGNQFKKKEKLRDTIKYIIETEIIDISFNDIKLKDLDRDQIESVISDIIEEFNSTEELINRNKISEIDNDLSFKVWKSILGNKNKEEIKNILIGKVLKKTKKKDVDVGESNMPTGEEKVPVEKEETEQTEQTDKKKDKQKEDKEEKVEMDYTFTTKILTNLFQCVLYLYMIDLRDTNEIIDKKYKIDELTKIFKIVWKNKKKDLNTHFQSWYSGKVIQLEYEPLKRIIKALKINLTDNCINKIMSELINNINDPIFMSEWCDSNLISSDINRMDNGEVFTPLCLIDDMFRPLSKVQPDFKITSDMKFLDIGSGRGNGSAYMYNMIFYNENIMNKYPNEIDRRNHILDNMLYMCEFSKENISILKDLFGQNNNNIIHMNAIGNTKDGGILSVDNPKLFELYKYFDNPKIRFDVIYINPPYQKPNKTDPGKFNGGPYFHHFVRLSIELLKSDGLLFAIHPPSWKKISDKRSAHNTDWYLKENTILYLNCSDKEDKFHGKTQKSVDYYILKKKMNDNSIETFVESEFNNDKFEGYFLIRNDYRCLPKHISESTMNIYNQLLKKSDDSFQLNFVRRGPGNDIDKNKLRFKIVNGKKVYDNQPDETYKYKIYGQFNNGKPCYNYSINDSDNRTMKKLICGIKINIENFTKSFVIDDKGEIIPGNESLHIIDDDIEKLQYIKLLFSSNLFIYLLKMCCYSRTNQGLDQIEFNFLNTLNIPNMNLIDKQDINKSLYEYYNVSRRDILMINNILNEKDKIISKNWKEYGEKYKIKGKKEEIIYQIIQKSVDYKISDDDLDDNTIRLDIDNDIFYYDIIQNKFKNLQGLDITDEYSVKYNIV